MPYRTVAHGTILTPQDFQDLFDFVYDPSTQAYRKLDDSFLSDAATDIKSRVASHFDELKVSKVSGLTVTWNAGTVRYEDGVVREISSGSLLVADNATNYVYVNEDADVVSSTSEPSGLLLLATVLASGGIVNAVNDRRARWSVPIPFGGNSNTDQAYTILDLTDTPSSYTGHGGKILAIKQDESGIEFVTRQSSSAGVYAVVDEFVVVDGTEVTLSAGITSIQNDAPLLPSIYASSHPDVSRISVSSIYSSSHPKWGALTHGTTTNPAWNSARAVNPATTPQWWKYDFPSAVSIGRLTWSNRSSARDFTHGQLKDFKIQDMTSGSPVDILTVTGHPIADGGVLQEASLSAAVTGVESIRVWVTDVHAITYPSEIFVDIAQLQFYSNTTASNGLGSISGSFVKARKAILSGITVLGDKAFVSCGISDDSDRIFSIDTLSRSVVGDFDLDDTVIYDVFTSTDSAGGSYSFNVQQEKNTAPIAAYAPSNKLFIAVGNIVKVFSSTNGNLIAEIDCGEATEIQGLAVSEEQQKVYGASKAGAIVVIDEGTNTLITTLTADDDAAYGGENYAVAVDDSRDAVYITSRSTNKVLVLNTVTDTLVTSINVGSTPEGIALSESDGVAICCNRTANTVSIINTTNNTVGASIAMSSVGSGAQPTAVAIDENATPSRAVVCLEAYNQVAIINLSNNQIEGRASAFAPVDAKFVPSTNEIYVAGEDGRITVIKRDN